jgi:hypothetical protein
MILYNCNNSLIQRNIFAGDLSHILGTVGIIESNIVIQNFSAVAVNYVRKTSPNIRNQVKK